MAAESLAAVAAFVPGDDAPEAVRDLVLVTGRIVGDAVAASVLAHRNRATLLCVDVSGSMAGGDGLGAVQQTLQRVPALLGDADVHVMLYNHQARMSTLRDALHAHANGCTNFVAALELVQRFVLEHDDAPEIQVVFMTDGAQYPANPRLGATLRDTRAALRAARPRVTVHTLGFRTQHDHPFLDQLRGLGDAEGVYRYAEAGAVLSDRFDEMLDFLGGLLTAHLMPVAAGAEGGAGVEVDVHMASEARPADAAEAAAAAAAPEATFSAVLTKADYARITAGGAVVVRLRGSAVVVPVSVRPALPAQLLEIVDAVNVASCDVLVRLGAALQQLNPARHPHGRRAPLQRWLEVARKLADFARVYAEQARAGARASAGDFDKRLSSLRFQQRVTNAGRARRMCFRALHNQALPEVVAARLRALPAPAVADVPPAMRELHCVLSMEEVGDVFATPDNLMVWGLRVTRPPHAPDQPEVRQVRVMAGAYSRDALEMHIAAAAVEGDAASVLGALGVRLTDEVSAFRGPDGQASPNAYLPLALCPAHLARAVAQVEPLLGLLFCGDPLQFHGRQFLALHALLAQLAMAAASEWERARAADLHALCHALRGRTLAAMAAQWREHEEVVAGAGANDAEPVSLLRAFPALLLQRRFLWDARMALGMWLAARPEPLVGAEEVLPALCGAARVAQDAALVHELVRALLLRAAQCVPLCSTQLWQVVVGLRTVPSDDDLQVCALAAAAAAAERAAQAGAAARAAGAAAADAAEQQLSPLEAFALRRLRGDAGAVPPAEACGARASAPALQLPAVLPAGELAAGEEGSGREALADSAAGSTLAALVAALGRAMTPLVQQHLATLSLAQRRSLAASVLLTTNDAACLLGTSAREQLRAKCSDEALPAAVCELFTAALRSRLRVVAAQEEVEQEAGAIAAAPSELAFAGMLLARGVRRGSKLAYHLSRRLAVQAAAGVPLAAEKLILMLRGTWVADGDPRRGAVGEAEDVFTGSAGSEYALMDGGAVWLHNLSVDVLLALRGAMGAERFYSLEEQLLGRSAAWMYGRDAGVNRHGFGARAPNPALARTLFEGWGVSKRSTTARGVVQRRQRDARKQREAAAAATGVHSGSGSGSKGPVAKTAPSAHYAPLAPSVTLAFQAPPEWDALQLLDQAALVQRWADEQARLKARVVQRLDEGWRVLPLPGAAPGEPGGPPALLAAADLAFSAVEPSLAAATLVVTRWPGDRVVWSATVSGRVPMPYVSGFLAFRELPLLAQLWNQLLATRPDLRPSVVLMDGNGVLHQRGLGLASHFGVVAGVATVGVAKNPMAVDGLTGAAVKALATGAEELVVPIVGASGAVWGAAVRHTRESKNPLYVSVGHRVDLDTAVALVQATRSPRSPLPLVYADMLCREYMAKLDKARESGAAAGGR